MLRDKINIRVELKGEEAEKFLTIKENRGLRNNTEVVRQLILEETKRLREEASPGA